MKIAWICHRDLQSRYGGAEMSDLEMLAQRPLGVEVTQVLPGGVDEEYLRTFDRVVVTGMYGYSSRELNIIGRFKPLMKAHDVQFSGHWLYEQCSRVICHTEMHVEYEMKHNHVLKRDKFVINPGTLEGIEYTPEFVPLVDRLPNTALWAHRPVPQKGLDLAAEWAREAGVDLIVLVNRPREEILQALGDFEYFVCLTHEFDPYPRAVMEAQVSGCRLVLNDNVGCMPDLSAEELRELLMKTPKMFWDEVMK